MIMISITLLLAAALANPFDSPAIRGVAFRSDGVMIAAEYAGDLHIGDRVIHVHDGRLVAFAAAHDRVATAGWDGRIVVTDAVSGAAVFTASFPRERPIDCLALSADGTRLAMASIDHILHILDVDSGREIARFQANDPWELTFSTDGALLAMGVRIQPSGSRILLFDVRTGKQLRQLEGDLMLGPPAFSPDGRRLATAAIHSTAYVWDVTDGGPARPMIAAGTPVRDCPLESVAFSPDGRLLAAGGSDAKIHIFDAVGGEEIAAIETRARSSFTSVAFSADDRRIAAGGFGGAGVWPVPERPGVVKRRAAGD
jgi:WD40 repeat protein